jgi:hypothetical protein
VEGGVGRVGRVGGLSIEARAEGGTYGVVGVD